jgi:hypothetical protein
MVRPRVRRLATAAQDGILPDMCSKLGLGSFGKFWFAAFLATHSLNGMLKNIWALMNTD